MRSILLGAVAAAVLFAAPVFAADEFAPSYKVEGTDPDGGADYKGDVTVRQTGDATFEVVWTIGSDKFVGTGIGGPSGLAVGYKSGSSTGIAIFTKEANGVVEGFWTYAGGKKIGQEKWTPK